MRKSHRPTSPSGSIRGFRGKEIIADGFFETHFSQRVPRSARRRHTDSSFEQLSEEQLEAHLKVCRYGNFVLTEAVRPSYDLQVVPSQGYRHDCFSDEETKVRVPVLMAAATNEELFETFLDLLDPLGCEVDVVLETSHNRDTRGHVDLYREHIDLPVLKSMLCDYEDLLLNDGCTGIAVLEPEHAAGSAVRRAQAADRLRARACRRSKTCLRRARRAAATTR